MTRRVHAGRVAARGMASGILRRDRPAQSTAARPATTVIAAVSATLQQLRTLQQAAGKLGNDILQFQIEMLEDDLFVRELLDRAAALKSAPKAVQSVLDDHIHLFLGSETETFAARSADLVDLRDRLVASFRQHDGAEMSMPEGTILLVEDIAPSRFLETDWSKVKGIAAQAGSIASHVALLARSKAIPMLVGLGEVDSAAMDRPVLLDAVSGRLIIDPEPAESVSGESSSDNEAVPEEEARGPADLPDGTRVRVNLSVNSLADLDEAQPEWFDGIGLARTELLMTDPGDLLREGVQADVYGRLFDWAGHLPVTIRLFDAGGDKPIAGFSPVAETNAFLGTRGARILAKRPDVLLTQYRAILGAAAGRPVRILVPMLTLPREMTFFRERLEQVIEERRADPAGVTLGMMVETPSAVLEIGNFAADFYAIGTNDLLQYTLAASRDNAALDFGDDMAPAVLDLIDRVVRESERRGSDVTLCGDAATSRVQLKQILECGIRSIAIPGRFAPSVKQFIRSGG
jgi:phosphotransferase system enzyme I (PtsI)